MTEASSTTRSVAYTPVVSVSTTTKRSAPPATPSSNADIRSPFSQQQEAAPYGPYAMHRHQRWDESSATRCGHAERDVYSNGVLASTEDANGRPHAPGRDAAPPTVDRNGAGIWIGCPHRRPTSEPFIARRHPYRSPTVVHIDRIPAENTTFTVTDTLGFGLATLPMQHLRISSSLEDSPRCVSGVSAIRPARR